MIPSLFSRLPPADSDPVFAIAAEAGAAGSGRIDATVGMILDAKGSPLVLPCVRRAVAEWSAALPQGDFAYPPLLGLPAFRSSVTRLVFGDPAEEIASIATTGGTGAVLLHLKLMKLLGITEVILPVPSWPNHRRLLLSLGFIVREVPYLERGVTSLRGIVEAFAMAAKPCGILLQACGHNPTGLDLRADQWRELADFLHGKEHVVLLDLAYQGLVRGVEEDAAPARLLRDARVPLLVTWSASKNHSIYGLRTGLACAVASDPAEREELDRHFMILTREVHSAASVTGQQIVVLVQQKHAEQWRTDLKDLRATLARKRQSLMEAIPHCADALAGAGLYALLPCSTAQIDALKRQKIFLLPDGRVNIAGIPDARLEEFTEACRQVIGS